MFKKIKNFWSERLNESGRSMVEMLGVLAVIGVLTIGALAGYNYAMNKYRANEILHGINMRYTVAQQQLTLGTPINMSEFDSAILGDYKVEVEKYDDTDNAVMMRIYNVPADVAKQLFASGSGVWKLPMLRFAIVQQWVREASNGINYPQIIPSAHAESEDLCDLGDMVTLWFLFATELQSCTAGGNTSTPTITW